MSRSYRLIAALLAATALPASAQAATYVFTGTLSGSQQVPPVATPGTGNVNVTFDDVLRSLRIDTYFSDLLSPTVAAHIHIAAAPGGVGPVATMLPTFVGFPTGVTAGSYDATFDLSSPASYNPAFLFANGGTPEGAQAALVAGLQSGLAYFNVHTIAYPNGEVRANLGNGVSAVPEPASWAMMLAGFGLLGGAMRSRRMTVRFS